MPIVTDVLAARAAVAKFYALATNDGFDVMDLSQNDHGDEMLSYSVAMASPKNLNDPGTSLVWVSEQMTGLAVHAGASLPPYDFDVAVLPWSSALCVFGTSPFVIPLPETDDEIPVRAVQWFASGEACLVNLLCYHHGADVLAPLSVITLSKGVAWSQIREDGTSDADESVAERAGAFLCALWLLVQQRVSVQTKEHARRADRRRWDEDGEIPDVTVVELRRPASTGPKTDDHEPVDWSHRWVVDGHWRNQYHPSTDTHVPTWIAPYVKGPEDKPLVVKTKIKAWVR